ncbi:MAG: F0F1 ATP synthase subunit gamma [Candidatus Ancillula trichonymphae]|jgi:F-type H+-transporting ATPase subunit gamma|nr:F0F1 ATP synthase subunit gamma [Candidatus Ancillula trichonymphae]
MVSQLEYKKRIASTKSLQKIFNAQELVAASHIYKARILAQDSRPYVEVIAKVAWEVASYTSVKHPLTATRQELGMKSTNRVAVLCVTSDRGMAGSYSATVIRETEKLCKKLIGEGKTPVLFISGRRGRSYYQFRGHEIAAYWEGDSDAPTFERAVELGDTLLKSFLSTDERVGTDQLQIVCTEFVNMVTQKPHIVNMLPLSIDADISADADNSGDVNAASSLPKKSTTNPLYIFEPGEKQTLDVVLSYYIYALIHECLLDAAASETASRQRAMHTATENAKSLIEELTRKQNKARQAGITQELTEIVSSSDALSSKVR